VLSFSVHTGRSLSPAMKAVMLLIERELAISLRRSPSEAANAPLGRPMLKVAND
jgi:hypothetical protein